MDFFTSHWHCILPVIGIILALIFLREKPNDKNNTNKDQSLKTNSTIESNSFSKDTESHDTVC